MANITTESIINFLPFPADQKLKILEKYQLAGPQEKSDMTELIWNGYSVYFNFKLQANFSKSLKLASKTHSPIDGNFYSKIVDQTEKEVETELIKAGESIDLDAARKAMQQIVQAINAAKTSPKPQKTS